MISAAILFLSLFTSGANAQGLDLSGTWTGSGAEHYSDKDSISCSHFIFDFRQNESELELIHGEVSCQYGPQEYLPFIAEIKGDRLISENPDFSGEITKDLVAATWLNPYDSSESKMEFKFVNGVIYFTGVARTLDGRNWTKTEAILKKK